MTRREFFLGKREGKDAVQGDLLSPWQPSAGNPWDTSAVNFLYSRLGFGAQNSEIITALASDPQKLVTNLLDDSLTSTKLPSPPEDSDAWLKVPPYTGTDDSKYHTEYGLYLKAKMDLKGNWVWLMSQPDTMLREKMMLFWINHFVIGIEKVYQPQLVYKFMDYLRRNAWGNFKQMVKDITIQPAMLFYLDNMWNEADHINENYAREVMELFTMGRIDQKGNENYSQDDVRAVALALCGWRYDNQTLSPELMPPIFANYYFDFTTKTTPFGAPAKVYGIDKASKYALFTVNLDKIEADIIELIFSERAAQIAYHIAEKIYSVFVYHDTTTSTAQSVISELADLFQSSNWEIKPVLLKLFGSEHFFDTTHRGSSIKSPIEFIISTLRKLDIDPTFIQSCNLALISADMDQDLLQPPNVKGWPGYRNWLNSTVLPKRDFGILRNLIMNGWLPGNGINPRNGFVFDGINLQDADILKWVAQIPDHDGDYINFVTNLANLFLPFSISLVMITQIATDNGPAHFYEWPVLPDDQRAGIIRKLLFAITQLAEYELQ